MFYNLALTGGAVNVSQVHIVKWARSIREQSADFSVKCRQGPKIRKNNFAGRYRTDLLAYVKEFCLSHTSTACVSCYIGKVLAKSSSYSVSVMEIGIDITVHKYCGLKYFSIIKLFWKSCFSVTITIGYDDNLELKRCWLSQTEYNFKHRKKAAISHHITHFSVILW